MRYVFLLVGLIFISTAVALATVPPAGLFVAGVGLILIGIVLPPAK